MYSELRKLVHSISNEDISKLTLITSNTSGLFAKQFQVSTQYGARPDPVVSDSLRAHKYHINNPLGRKSANTSHSLNLFQNNHC